MNIRYNIFQKIIAAVLALVLIIGLMPTISPSATAVSTDSSLTFVEGSKIADDATLNEWVKYFGEDKLDTEFAGAVWTDKSVLASANTNLLPGVTLNNSNNFLVALSAIAANSVITGHTTVPTDTMLVLDLSGSMATAKDLGYDEEGDEIRGKDVALVQAMVDATNAAIEELMTQNTNNRVGVVLYSGNTSTSDDATVGSATVILPLGRYQGVSVGEGEDAHLEYLSMDATTQTKSLYEWVSTGWGRGYWQDTGKTVTYTGSNSDIDVSVKNGLTTEAGTAVSDRSKEVVGGTYIQNGLYQAWEQFEQVTDTIVPEGNAQAGAERMPVIVLMSDGAPTIATASYNDVGTSHIGTGSSTQNDATLNRIAFLTQLTAAYVKGAVADHYKETEDDEQDVLFLTLGLGTESLTSGAAQAYATLYPAGSNETLTGYWNTYLNASDGSTVTVIPDTSNQDDNSLKVVRDDLVEAMNYVDHYYLANDAQELIDSFSEIIGEIQLQAEYYTTLVEGDNADLSGYVTFEDELGELMEVSDMKGILLGDTLFTGMELAKGLNEDALGAPGASTARGDDFIATVKERITGTTTTQAQQLVDNAYNAKQLYYNEETGEWSNYIGWYAKEDGTYAGFWDADTYGYENAPTDAVYANKSYGYLGVNGNSDMMHVVVMVRTNLKTLHQTVYFKIPAALLPTVTYNVTLDESDPTAVTAFDREGADPMRLVFEVGLRSDINSVNLEQKIADHLANGGHIHKNENDGTYSFYTNSFSVGNDTNQNGIPDPDEVDSAIVAEAHFHPALENGRFYYTEDDLLLDANGDPVTGDTQPSGTGYYHALHIYSEAGADIKAIPVSAATLKKALQNDDGQWYIPEGTPYLEYTRFRSPKGGDNNNDGEADRNLTGTLDYYFYPAAFADDTGSDVYMFLGNNGTFKIAPATGIALTKQLAEPIEGVDSFTFTIALSDIPDGTSANPIVTDANGAPLANVTSTDYENGQFTVTIPADVTAHLTGIPSGTTVTVTETIAGDYKVSGISVDGTAQAVSESVQVTVPTYSAIENAKLVLPVTFTNAPNGYGDLVITKDVHHPYDSDPDALASKEFTFQVKLTGDKIQENDTFNTSITGKKVKVGADGSLTFEDGSAIILKNEQSLTIYDIPEFTAYTVTETAIPNGFELSSINGSDAATEVSGTITDDAEETAAFINRYPDSFTPVEIPVDLTINKILNGNPSEDEDFVFVLQGLIPGTERYPTIETYTINSSAANKTVTDALTLSFETIGTYHYRIVELAPVDQTPAKENTNGMSYSTTRALFVVEVTDADMDGVLEATVRGEANIDVTPVYDTTDTDKIVSYNISADFTNTYQVHSTNTQVAVHKELRNNTGVEKPLTAFAFGLYETDTNGNAVGNPIQEITTSALGDATFNILITKDMDLTYVIKEIIPDGAVLNTETGKYELNGMIYDSTVYVLTIDVEAETDDQLVVNSQKLTVLGSDAELPRADFINEYVLTEASQEIPVSKELTGRPLKSGETFQFFLVRTNDTFTSALTGTDAYSDTISIGIGTDAFELEYTKAGTYHYTVTELPPSDSTYTLNGLTYDNAEYHVTITVTDNGSGALVASEPVIHKLGETEATNTAAFTNVYNVTGNGSAVIEGSKVLEGRLPVTGEFQFGLYDSSDTLITIDGAPAIAENRPDGTFVFDALEYTAADLGENNAAKTYTYYVKEILPAGGSYADSKYILNGVTYDQTEYPVTVTVSHKDGALVVTASDDADDIVITNTYKADGVTATINGSKTLVGDWSNVKNETKTFTFNLYAANASFQVTNTTPVKTATVDGNGTFSIELDFIDGQEGYYYYILREDTSANAGGVGYDAGIYQVTISVTDPGKGSLSAQVSMYRPGVGNTASAAFSNSYTVASTEVTLNGTKKLTGRDMIANEFTFNVLENGHLVSRGKNAAAKDGETASITFDPIIYTSAGIHVYTIEEVNGGKGGVAYNPTGASFTITVTVTDNGDGTLSTDVDYSAPVAFENTYSTKSTSVALEGTKVLTGRDMDANEFTFHVLENGTKVSEGKNTAAKEGAAASITFDSITYTEAGVHNYIIKEVEGTNPGMDYDTDAAFEVTVTVTDNGDGTLSTNVVYKAPVAFSNTYEADPAKLQLKATKTYDKSLKDNKFTFTLTGTIGTTPISQEKQNDDNGNIVFDELRFDAPGTYEFEVAEKTDPLLGFIIFDQNRYKVTVVVEDNKQGQLIITEETYTLEKGKQDSILFNNEYFLKGEDTLELGGTKTISGDRATVKDQEFSFGLYDSTGKLVETVKNNGDGKFSFEAITFDESDVGKDISYTVKEILPVDGNGDPMLTYKGITYDDRIYTIDVTVSDNEVGGVEVSYTVNNNATTPITFSNKYEITGTDDLKLEGTKTFTDGKLDADDFAFGLYDDDNDLVDSDKNDANGKFSLEVKGFDKDDIGKEIIYTVKEILPKDKDGNELTEDKGVTYDKAVYTVTVTVTDNGEGGVDVDYTVSGTGSIAFTNKYAITGTAGFELEGAKKLTGRTMKDGEFSFGLYDADGKLVDDDTNTDGKFTLKAAGLGKDHIGKAVTYTVKEILPKDADNKELSVYHGVTYDKTVYTINVTVTDNGEGGVDVDYEIEDAESIVFENVYASASANVTLNVQKTIKSTGTATISPKGFSFVLKDADGKVIETVKSGEDGKVSFSALTYEAVGEHTYTISEVKGSATGVIYDTAIHTVNVEITDNGEGKLVAAVKQNGTAVDSVIAEFVNTYEPPETPVTGDDFDLVLCSGLMLLSAVSLVVLILCRKKKESVQ